MNNDNRIPIQEALHVVQNAENVEIIELELEGYQRVLVRSKAMPEFAFLVWSSHQTGTYSRLGLDLPEASRDNSSYEVVCACCPTYTDGVSTPVDVGERESESYKKWSDGLSQVFKVVLNETCKKHGITTIFMRRASDWSLGALDDINIVEASCHEDAMLDLYGRRIVEAHTRFISRRTSRAMR